MQSTHCVHIVFVIGKEDISHKMERLYQYLSNYERGGSINSNNVNNKMKVNSKVKLKVLVIVKAMNLVNQIPAQIVMLCMKKIHLILIFHQ